MPLGNTGLRFAPVGISALARTLRVYSPASIVLRRLSTVSPKNDNAHRIVIFLTASLWLAHFLPLMRFELTASPLPRECATPAPQGHIKCVIVPAPSGSASLSKNAQWFAFGCREPKQPDFYPLNVQLTKIADDGTRTRNLRFTKPLLYH